MQHFGKKLVTPPSAVAPASTDLSYEENPLSYEADRLVLYKNPVCG